MEKPFIFMRGFIMFFTLSIQVELKLFTIKIRKSALVKIPFSPKRTAVDLFTKPLL
jgi:hypothetical protein